MKQRGCCAAYVPGSELKSYRGTLIWTGPGVLPLSWAMDPPVIMCPSVILIVVKINQCLFGSDDKETSNNASVAYRKSLSTEIYV
jgi:hypothetical protein